MSSPTNNSPYRVELGSSALSQLGSVPAEVFQRLRNELQTLANTLQEGGDGAAAGLRALKLDSFAAVYEVDSRARSVRLLGVIKRDGAC